MTRRNVSRETDLIGPVPRAVITGCLLTVIILAPTLAARLAELAR